MENTNLTRKQQKIFAGNTTITDEQIAVFGSKTKTGTMQFSLDPDSIQTESWGEGWQGATVLEQAPFEEDFNAISFVNSYNIAYLFQKGIPEYSENTTYFKGSICLVIDNDKPTLYYSKTDNNTGNNPATDSTNWSNLFDIFNGIFANVNLSNLSTEGQAIIDNKVNLDGSNATFSNLSNTAKDNIVNLFQIDYSAGISISSTTYTPPANGIIIGEFQSTGANSFGAFYNITQRIAGISNGPTGQFLSTFILVNKGEEYKIDMINSNITFYPFKNQI